MRKFPRWIGVLLIVALLALLAAGAWNLIFHPPSTTNPAVTGAFVLVGLAATVLFLIAGIGLWQWLRAAQETVGTSAARTRAMIAAMPDLLFRIDRNFRFLDCQTGDPARLYAPPEVFIGRTIREVLPEEAVLPGERAITQALATGQLQTDEYMIAMPTGREWYELRAAPISADEVLVIVRDISERHHIETLTHVRLHLLEYAATHTLDELLQETLDRVGELVNSPVGFFHFVLPDQKTLSLQAWSTRTLTEFCQAEGKGLHCDITAAGVWADAARLRTPIIHNDYASLPNRKELPAGHAQLVRELVAPILRGDRVVALLGVGNKPTAYDAADVSLVNYLADVAWEIAERKRVEENLLETERLYRQAITSVGGVAYQRIFGAEVFAFLGDGFEALTGYSPAEMDGELFSSRLRQFEAYGELKDLSHEERKHLAREGKIKEWRIDYQFERKDGSLIWLADRAVQLFDSAGKVTGTLGILMDITENKRAAAEQIRLQAQLAQAQKLEAVGRLAGGVAHDFNNMLAVILMRIDMAMRQVEPASPLRRHLQEIEKTAQRSAELTRQLLGYARRQTIAPRPLDLNAAVENMLSLLHRLIGEDVRLIWTPGAALWIVQIDPTQVDQILTNLCVNARDAIAGVGQVQIKTENVVIDALYAASRPELQPGRYVRLTVADDGAGMSQATLGSIFEPFFTTKEQGKGTGLGLATVYGIVQQNHGHIQVYSEPGVGTTFVIYLPAAAEELSAVAASDLPVLLTGNGETVLLVEDELLVLEMGAEILENLGYVVLTANSPSAALATLADNPNPVDLLITDVIMPEMTGKELADRITALRPSIKRLFMSGYPAEFIAHRGVLEPGVHFLQKPFTLEALASQVRMALGDGAGGAQQ